MKITGYQQQVNNGGVGNATVKAVGDVMAYGGNGTGLKSVAQGIGAWANVIAQKQEEDDKQNILKAMDEYNKGRFEIMYNQDNGLMNTALDRSEGISDRYIEQEKKLRGDVLKGVKLYNQKNMVALNSLMDNSARQGYESVYRYQTKQKVAANEVRFSDYIDKQNEYAQNNYGNFDIVNSLMQQADLMTDLHYRNIGGEALVKEKQKQAKGSIAASSITSAITHEDYATARKLKDAYGSFLTTEQRAAFEKVLYQKEAANYEYNLGNQLYQLYGDDEAAVRKALEEANGFTENISDLDALLRAIGGQESGGDYGATNSRTKAFGKYQIMPENWPKWSREAGLPEGAEQTPENQEIVARYKLGEYLQKYGAEGAAAAWYGGEGAVNWGDEARNRKQGNGNEPSVNEYVAQVMGRIGDARTSKPMSLDEKNRTFQQYQMAKNAAKRQQTYLNTQIFDSAKDTLLQMRQKGISAKEAWKKVMAMSGANANTFTLWKKAYSAIYNRGGGNGQSIGKGVDILLEQLKESPALQVNKGVFMEYCAGKGANDSDMEKLDKGYNDFLQGKGVFKYNFDDMASNIIQNNLRSEKEKARLKRGLTNVGMDFVRKYRADHQGFDPDESLVEEAMTNAITKIPLGSYVTHYGTFWDSTKDLNLSMVDLASAGINTIKRHTITEYDYRLGREIEVVVPDEYDITYRDGRMGGTVNGAYLEDITGVNK